MSPFKAEFLLKLSLGFELIVVDKFFINVKTGDCSPIIPLEIKGHVKNILNRVPKTFEWSDSFEDR